MAVTAAKAPLPSPDSFLNFVFSEKKSYEIPVEFSYPKTLNPFLPIKEMIRDR